MDNVNLGWVFFLFFMYVFRLWLESSLKKMVNFFTEKRPPPPPFFFFLCEWLLINSFSRGSFIPGFGLQSMSLMQKIESTAESSFHSLFCVGLVLPSRGCAASYSADSWCHRGNVIICGFQISAGHDFISHLSVVLGCSTFSDTSDLF